MRIRDWSSAVVSSDLSGFGTECGSFRLRTTRTAWLAALPLRSSRRKNPRTTDRARAVEVFLKSCPARRASQLRKSAARSAASAARVGGPPRRSEEHTSELQSLMRISYAVFCLKKKNQNRQTRKNRTRT